MINNTDGVTNANLSVSGLQGSWKPVSYTHLGLKDGQGVEFNGHVQSGAQGISPDKVQPKDVTPSAESRTQVAVNTEGKTNEATKQGKEPLKQGQQKPTATLHVNLNFSSAGLLT